MPDHQDRKNRSETGASADVDKEKNSRNLQDEAEDALIEMDEDIRRNIAEKRDKDFEIASNAPDITNPHTPEPDGPDLPDRTEEALIEMDNRFRRDLVSAGREESTVPSNAPDITDPHEAENDKNIQDKTEDALIELEDKIRKDNQRTDRREGHIKSSNAPNVTDTPPRKKD